MQLQATTIADAPVEPWYYHAMDLPGVGTVGLEEGWDLRGRFHEYVGHVPLNGRTLLDVGAASGFLSFEAEKYGAIVTSFDAGTVDDREDVPENNEHATSYVADHLRRMHAGYDIGHRAYGSKAKIARGSIYRLSQIVPQHQIVIVGQILVHLKDPWNALREAASCCAETLVIVEGSFHCDQPYAVSLAGSVATSYWHISNALYRQWLDKLGFKLIRQKPALYRCNHPKSLADHTVWTFVATRK